jgi:hypothetical protein
VSGRLVKVLPITTEVITRVNQLGAKQQQPTVQDGELLYEWHPGQVFDSDDMNDSLWDKEGPVEREDEVLPEPVLDEHDDIFEATDDGNPAHEVTEDEIENNDQDEFYSQNEDDNAEEDADEDDGLSFNDSSCPNLDENKDDISFEENEFSPTSDIENELIVESEGDAIAPANQDQNQADESDTDDELLFGRGMHTQKPNPQYYGEDFTHFQFLQLPFDDLDLPLKENYREYALEQYRLSGQTHLVE